MKDEKDGKITITFATTTPKSYSYACQIIITKQKTQCKGVSESKKVSFSNYEKCVFD